MQKTTRTHLIVKFRAHKIVSLNKTFKKCVSPVLYTVYQCANEGIIRHTLRWVMKEYLALFFSH